MSQLRFLADVAGDTHERDADTHDRAAHHAVALSTRNRASASRPHRSLRRLEARDSTRDEAAFHQHACLPNSSYGSYIATRDMAHSELKAYSSDEEIEDAHEDEIRCVCAPSFTHRRGDRARRRISPRSSPAERARARFVPWQRASSVSARIPSSDRDILPPFSNAVRSRSSRNCRPGCAGWTP